MIWQSQQRRLKATYNHIPLQKLDRPADHCPFTPGAKRFKSLSDKECISLGIGAFQLVIITKNRVGPMGSSVNWRPIRYGFRGARITDPVYREHSLRVTNRTHPKCTHIDDKHKQAVFGQWMPSLSNGRYAIAVLTLEK